MTRRAETTGPRTSQEIHTADEIAEMASRGKDISSYFTNKFKVVRPVGREHTPRP